MASRIEDYALIGDLRTAALVGRDGAIDWWCVPRFDSPAAFAALLGDADNGRWLLAPEAPVRRSERRYRAGSLILETTLATDDGEVRLIEFMPLDRARPAILRVVEGLRGRVGLRLELAVRTGYGELPPWTRAVEGGCTMTVIGDGLALYAERPLTIVEHDVRASFTVCAGERVAMSLAWYPSHDDAPGPLDVDAELTHTAAGWANWGRKLDYEGPYDEAIHRSALILKALFSEPYGASIAAVTTSLPERLGGDKNWDYRYAWVRDSCFTIDALLHVGLDDEALRWRDWVLRALAGSPEKLQIMYGLGGERRIEELELDHLRGYAGSGPVRIGNAAYTQFQLGIYGQTMAAMELAHARGVPLDDDGWAMMSRMLAHVTQVWTSPDSGIWESRGDSQHYTHSKVEAWRAFDRALAMVRVHGYPGDAENWAALAARIKDEVCAHAFDRRRGTFVQAYGSDELDASMLLLPLIGFLPGDDPRITGTIQAVEDELLEDGFVYRTSNDPATGAARTERSEGAFLPCNFWLVEAYAMQGRVEDARRLFERVLGVAGDLGLLAEEYDPRSRRLVGNVPQTLTHATLINAAVRLREAAAKIAVCR